MIWQNYSRSSETPHESEFCLCSLKQRYVSAIWQQALNMTQSAISHQLQDPEAEQTGQEQTGKVNLYFIHLADDHVRTIIASGTGTHRRRLRDKRY